MIFDFVYIFQYLTYDNDTLSDAGVLRFYRLTDGEKKGFEMSKESKVVQSLYYLLLFGGVQ